MAGFEVVVRPVVFPNIRPAPARVFTGADDPEKNKAVIQGSGAKFMGTSMTWTVNLSRQLPHTEAVRQFNKERVYQKDKQGRINKNTYVDLERLKRVRLNRGEEPPYKVLYADPPESDNVEVLQADVTRSSSE